MASAIDHILSPKPLNIFKYPSRVTCKVWLGQSNYDTITLDTIYPFDTIDTITYLVCNHYKREEFLPNFLFIGIPQAEDEKYIPLDYLWFPIGSSKPTDALVLHSPTIKQRDDRFVSRDGSFTNPTCELRGRSTIEDVLLKYDNEIPELHVFPLAFLLRSKTVTDEVWNGSYASYFPNVSVRGTHQPTEDDFKFGRMISSFLEKRRSTVQHLEKLLQRQDELPPNTIDGIQQLMLVWKRPIDDFEGAANVFYKMRVTEQCPYLRLIPSDGAPISKIHVRGVLPIPTMNDPRLLSVWSKERSVSPGHDICTIKYLHRKHIGIMPSIYGTIHVENEGTIKLVIQPPKDMRALDPNIDFRTMNQTLETIFQDLPQEVNDFEIKELALRFKLNVHIKSKQFTAARIRKRLPYFSYFVNEIKKLPDDNAMMVLRYKAVSQYKTESEVATFITQLWTQHKIQGETLIALIITTIQEEFQVTETEAKEFMTKWLQDKEKFMVQNPEEGEFTETNNAGIDIKLYAQHPFYYVQLQRVNSIHSYYRIYTLLSILFMDNDDYFKENSDAEQLGTLAAAVEDKQIELEEKSDYAEMNKTNVVNGALLQNEDEYDPFAGVSIESPIEPQHAPIAAASVAVKQEHADQRRVDPQSWFINRLQEIDEKLFVYKATEGYSRQCGNVDDRQPVILTEEDYQRMRLTYEDDNIFWLLYPLTGNDDPVQPSRMDETITIMRYGSSGNKLNYMFCPEFFCLSCEIMIRATDFRATEDREGEPKAKNSCPFCRGLLITKRKGIVEGATVFQRNRDGKKKYSEFIGFIKKSSHPDGLALPCCFIKQTTLRSKDPQFKDIQEFLKDKVEDKIKAYAEQNNIPLDEDEYEDEDEDEDDIYSGDLVLHSEKAINYIVLFGSIHKRYILESNKYPSPGIFAMIPPYFDKFFLQNSTNDIVKRTSINLLLQPNARGFIRIGTQNTIYESLLGVIAPIIDVTTIHDVKIRLKQFITPRVFMNAHFGNLVLEFYNPAQTEFMPQTEQELKIWSQRSLGIQLNSKNRYELLRIYNAYGRFIFFIDDESQRKDLRHIQPLLSEPGLFTSQGIQLVIMEDNDGIITMKCPVFGVSIRHKQNAFVFVSKQKRVIPRSENTYNHYELFVYTSNKGAKGREIEVHDTILRWDVESSEFWPSIVAARINEYTDQCKSRYISIYTPAPDISPNAIISLSYAYEHSPYHITGILKDAYNHIIAVTFSIDGVKGSVALPVIDDGALSISTAFNIKNIFLSWDDFVSAPIDQVIEYYNDYIIPTFTRYPGYRIKYAALKTGTNDIIALQLTNGIYIPVTVTNKDDLDVDEPLPEVQIEEFQWNIDKKMDGVQPKEGNWKSIVDDTSVEKRCGSDEFLVKSSTYSEVEEVYQQFRYMVSNYIVQTPAVKNQIEQIIFTADFPFYEKRKRLYIYFGTLLKSWFYSDKDWEASVSFLRKDCRVITNEADCNGSCHWKQTDDEKAAVGEGKCLLHVKDQISLDGTEDNMVNTSELFTKRVIDELVYFPQRRNQLMKKGDISKVSKIIKPVRIDDQYIIPEESVSWVNLLRLEWLKTESDGPKYYEEMSREGEEEPEVSVKRLPEALQTLLGEDSTLQFYVPDNQDPAQPFVSFSSILQIELDKINMAPTSTTLTEDNLTKYIKYMKRPIGCIDMDTNKRIYASPFDDKSGRILMFVRIGNQIGLLIEKEGDDTVPLALLPKSTKKISVKLLRKAPVNPVPLLADVEDVPLPQVQQEVQQVVAVPVQKPRITRIKKRETQPKKEVPLVRPQLSNSPSPTKVIDKKPTRAAPKKSVTISKPIARAVISNSNSNSETVLSKPATAIATKSTRKVVSSVKNKPIPRASVMLSSNSNSSPKKPVAKSVTKLVEKPVAKQVEKPVAKSVTKLVENPVASSNPRSIISDSDSDSSPIAPRSEPVRSISIADLKSVSVAPTSMIMSSKPSALAPVVAPAPKVVAPAPKVVAPAPKVVAPAPKVEPSPAPKVEPIPAPKVEPIPAPKVEPISAPKVEPAPTVAVASAVAPTVAVASAVAPALSAVPKKPVGVTIAKRQTGRREPAK